MLAVRPHWINQISTEATSTVGDETTVVNQRGLVKKNLSVGRLIESYYEGLVRKALKKAGMYEGD